MLNASMLDLIKDYSREKHKQSIPWQDSNLPGNLVMIYSTEWEKENITAPYEILTQIMDCYYCLPERPDLATLFCWQAINHSYNEFLLVDSKIEKLNDSKGITALVDGIMKDYGTYKKYLWPYIVALPDKAYRYVAAYVLKGYVIEQAGKKNKFYTQSYVNFKKGYEELYKVISETFGDILYKASAVSVEGNVAKTNIDPKKNRRVTISLAQKFRNLVENKTAEFEMRDGSRRTLVFSDREAVDFVVRYILYASRCNNFHGNVASRLNSDHADEHSFEMYTKLFLLEYMILGISLHIQKYLTNADLERLMPNSKLTRNFCEETFR